MNPSMSTNPGESINFDAQALHNQEEAEYEREEQLRQRELRDLLTTEFDDDLTDEDEEGSAESTGITSNDENDHPDRHHPGQPDPVRWDTPGQIPSGHLYGLSTSTPITANMSPLSTLAPYHHPAPTPYPAGDVQYAGATEAQYQYPTHDQEWDVPHQPMDQQGRAFLQYPPREEAEGGPDHAAPPTQTVYDTGQQQQLQHQLQQQQQLQLLQQQYFSAQPPKAVPEQDRLPYGAQQSQTNPHQSVGVADSRSVADSRGIYYPVGASDYPGTTLSPHRPPVAGGREDTAPPTQDLPRHFRGTYGGDGSPGIGGVSDLQGYRVQYKPGGAHDKSEKDVRRQVGTDIPQLEHDVSSLQRDFLSQGGASEGRQLAQLQILYSARGQKIEDLSKEVQSLRDDSDREIRILKHKLTLTHDERDGLEESLKQSQTLLSDSRRLEAERQGRVSALETQVGALQGAKEELIKKLQTAESTIESLNVQLCALETSESLARSREQHDNIVTGMAHKYEVEIYDLKQRLDRAVSEIDAKTVEIETLNKKVMGLMKNGEDSHIERADTINRLSRSLEESQRQCQQMLEAGTGQELSKMKVQLQEVIAGKSIAEDMNSALTEELQDLKEQVMMYESASQYGIMTPGSTSSTPRLGGTNSKSVAADDSYLQLGIKAGHSGSKEEPGSSGFTPRSATADGASLNTEQTLQGLKKELERYLTMYRSKRQQVSGLQEDLRKSRHALEDLSEQLEKAQHGAEESARCLAQYEAEVGPLGGAGPGQETVHERRLQRQVDALTRDKKMLDEEVKELMARIEDIADNEEKVKEANSELSHQMAEMVREADEDKRQALQLCESTLIQHHERIKAQFEADLRDELTQEKDANLKQYKQQITELRAEVERLQSELDEVKDAYISVCQAKDHIREGTDQLWAEKMEAQLAQLREALEKEKEDEIGKLKITWASNNDLNLSTTKERWLKEQAETLKGQIEEQVSRCKADWLRDHAGAKDTAVRAALVAAERRWHEKWDLDLEKTLDVKLQEAKVTWTREKEAEFNNELVRRIQLAQTGAERDVHSDLKHTTGNDAATQGDTYSKVALEAEVARCVEEARLLWCTTDLPRAVEEQRISMEKRFQNHLEEARIMWRHTELATAVEEASSIQAGGTCLDASQDIKTKVIGMLEEAKAVWLEERRQEVETTMAKVKATAEADAMQRIEEAKQELQQEISELYSAKLGLEKEVSLLMSKMAEDRSEILASKDAERRKAVLTTQDQCERDYREFLSEHQDTLNRALRTAREEFAREKAEVERKHQEEVRGLREREARASQVDLQGIKEKAELEARWQGMLEEVSKAHADEKDLLMRTHRDNLLKALEEARARWQQKYEEALVENNLAALEEKEAAWTEERTRMETELDATKTTVAQHQEELAKLRAELEDGHQQDIDQLKAAHELELAVGIADLRKQLEGGSAEMERLLGEARECVVSLEEAQRVTDKEAQELRAAISQRDAEITRLKADLTAIREQVENFEDINKNMVCKLEAAQIQSYHLTQQADQLDHARKESEDHREKLTASFRTQHGELLERLQRAERSLKASGGHKHKQIALVQESMEHEHSVAMEKMKAKMVELRSGQVVAMDKLRKQHVSEKKEWRKQLEVRRRSTVHAPTQTDPSTTDSSTLADMGKQYLKTVNKIRAEVLQHVNDSNTHAAEAVREQIIKERTNTACRLRRYYMKCLTHLIDDECRKMTREEKLAYMEQAMEYIPSRDTSQVTSASSGGRSAVTTPDNLTPTTQPTTSVPTSSANKPKSNNASSSRVEFPSLGRTKDSQTQVKDVADSCLQTRVRTLVEGYDQRDDQTAYSGWKEDFMPYHYEQQNRWQKEFIPHSRARGELEQYISRSNHQRTGGGSVGRSGGLQSLDRNHTLAGQSRMDVPRLDLRQLHDTVEDHMPLNSHVNESHHTPSMSRRHYPMNQGHSSWDSETSSSDNAHHSIHYRSPESATRERYMGRKPYPTSQDSIIPSHHKYTLLSKSTDAFSIEKPRYVNLGKSYTDVSYEMDIEYPSVYKSQSTTCLEHSTPRGQYLTDSELRQYYDIDFHALNNSTIQPVQDGACGGASSLHKVSSDTYLQTPGLHGSMSMGDVRDYDEGDQSLVKTKPMCHSDEGLLNCDSEIAGRSYNAKSQPSERPQKSLSMPNVARAENWVNSARLKSLPENYLSHGNIHLDDKEGFSESTLRDSVSQPPQVTVKSNVKSTIQTYNAKSYKVHNSVNGRRERQYRVAFKNIETHCDDEASDNESVKSFQSTSSISDFRHALKSKQSQAMRTASSRDFATRPRTANAVKKPLKVPPPSEELQTMLAQVPDNTHKPVAMITRHTQMPSPQPLYKAPRNVSK